MEMGERNNHGQSQKTLRILLAILLFIFLGPVVVSILGSVVVGLVSFLLAILVVALFLLASPILMVLLPSSVSLSIPSGALFFFGVAALALFVLFTALCIRLIKGLFKGLFQLIKGIFT